MKRINLFLIVTVLLFLTACDKKQHRVEKEMHDHYSSEVKTYHAQNSSGDWLWYYVLFSNMGNHTSVYYYSSPTQVQSFNSTNFTKAGTTTQQLPEEVKEVMENNDPAAVSQLTSNDVPDNVETEAEQWTQLELDLNNPNEVTNESTNEASQEHSETVSESSVDSSSDSGDSGGSSE